MESMLLKKLSECIEYGKINQSAPYPPQMKDQEGADELTAWALQEGISPQDVLTYGLMPGMERIGVKFRANQVFVPQVFMVFMHHTLWCRGVQSGKTGNYYRLVDINGLHCNCW